MKKFTNPLLPLFFAVALILGGCNKDNDNNGGGGGNGKVSPLVAQWSYGWSYTQWYPIYWMYFYTDYFTFNKNGTFVYNYSIGGVYSIYKITGKYAVANGKVTFTKMVKERNFGTDWEEYEYEDLDDAVMEYLVYTDDDDGKEYLKIGQLKNYDYQWPFTEIEAAVRWSKKVSAEED